MVIPSVEALRAQLCPENPVAPPRPAAGSGKRPAKRVRVTAADADADGDADAADADSDADAAAVDSDGGESEAGGDGPAGAGKGGKAPKRAGPPLLQASLRPSVVNQARGGPPPRFLSMQCGL